MFLFCHVFAGMMLGTAARTGRIIGATAAASFGAIMPDLIDKPLGYLLLTGSLHQGRIFCHTLVFGLLLLAAGLAYGRWKGGIMFPLLTAGVFLHQLMDQMWQTPVHWLYPFLGPFPAALPFDFFGWSLAAEVSSLSEWVFLFATAAIVMALFHDHVPARIGSLFHASGRWAVPLVPPLLVALAGAGVLAGLNLLPFPMMAGTIPGKDWVLAAVAGVGAGLILLKQETLTGFRDEPEGPDA